jgi:hypothetical protein
MVINGDATCADDLCGKTHENGWFVDQSMCDFVQPYIEMAQSRSTATAEIKVKCGPMEGTSDLVSWSDQTHLHIDDLKYGYEIVEPFDNRQLLCYMTGFLDGGIPPVLERVTLGIYQPRALHRDGSYRTWTIEGRDQIMHWVHETRRMIARAADGTLATPGPHCNRCTRAHDCEALTHSVYAMWDVVHAEGLLQTTEKQVADEMEFLHRLGALLKARVSAVEADVEERIKRGAFVPGWALEERYGKRKFTVDRDTILAVTGVDPVEEKLCTPAELERRGVSKDVVKAMTTTPSIGRKLAPVAENNIAKLFGG